MPYCADLKDYKCPPGWEYSQCGSACEPTCESYLSVESQFRACPAVCVEGCFCKEGLIGYRDRCVDSRECYSLVNGMLANTVEVQAMYNYYRRCQFKHLCLLVSSRSMGAQI